MLNTGEHMSHYTLLAIGENAEDQLDPFCEQTEDPKYLEFFDAEKAYREDYETGKDTVLEWYPCDTMWLTTEEYKTLLDTGELSLKNHAPNRYFCSGILELENPSKKNNTVSIFVWDTENGSKKTSTCAEVLTYKRDLVKNVKDKFLEELKVNPPKDKDEALEFITKTMFPENGVTFIYDAEIKLIDSPKEIPVKEIYPVYSRCLEEWYGFEKDEKENKYGHWTNPNGKWDWYVLGGRWDNYFKLKNGTYSNQALKGDIDFEGMEKEAADKALITWEEAFSKNLDDTQRYFSYGISKDDTKESYIESCKSISTFAVLKDGNWYEKGKMGWWCSVADEMKPEEWKAEFHKMLQSVSDDTLLSLYDCHI